MMSSALVSSLLLISIAIVEGRLGELQSAETRPSTTADGLLDALAAVHGRRLSGEDEVPVIIGYRNQVGRRSVESHMKRKKADFDEIGAMAVSATVEELLAMTNDTNVAYIEPDSAVYATAQVSGYGIAATENDSGSAVAQAAQSYSSASCSSSSSLKIAIIDSGADIKHPDLPCQSGADCIGRDYAPDGSWSNPPTKHGTHVMGIIGAVRNDVGVEGMVHNPKACYIIAKVLDAYDSGSSSDIIDAVRWAASQGAKVINMSLAGLSYSIAANDMFDKIYKDGVLAVASAGNDGDSGFAYPASYTSVISVTAVGEKSSHAWFANTNSKVDLSAPGMNVVSTFPTSERDAVIATAQIGSKAFAGQFAKRSSIPSSAISGTLVNCPDANSKDDCPGSGEHVCIVEGARTPGGLARRCTGVAMIVYNEVADKRLAGNLPPNSPVSIPVFVVSNGDGLAMVGMAGETISIASQQGYGYLDGTSMAAPHVTGAIATLWQACPNCANTLIETCLKDTAKDLGEQGRDDVYGYGLIQTEDAYRCLTSKSCC